MYAKETQTDAVCIKDIKAEEEEDEEDKVLTSSASAVPVSRHEDDTIEPEKEVRHKVWVGWGWSLGQGLHFGLYAGLDF